jgi:hypothetical protein
VEGWKESLRLQKGIDALVTFNEGVSIVLRGPHHPFEQPAGALRPVEGSIMLGSARTKRAHRKSHIPTWGDNWRAKTKNVTVPPSCRSGSI